MSTALSAPTPTSLQIARVALLTQALERLGWTLNTAEIDLTCGTARIQVTRHGGELGALRATLAADKLGRVSITRELVSSETVAVGRRGDRSRVDRISTELVGRTRYEGVRSGLRDLCNYIADNALHALPRGEVRKLFEPLME